MAYPVLLVKDDLRMNRNRTNAILQVTAMVGLYCAEFMERISKVNQRFEPYVYLWRAANIIATIVTLLCGIRNIYNFVINYRRDMLLLYRGDRSFIPQNVMSNAPQAYMARGMRFIGTAIVGSLWGTVFCYLVVFVPMVTTFMVFRALHDTNKLHRLFEQFQWMIYPACVIAIFQLQMILIGRCFIQPRTYTNDKHKPLAVNNRNMYDIMCFFMLFVNASIGLFTFLKRILVGALMGMFLIPRMDRSLLMRGYEAMDKCYVNYIGMIMVDFAHNNPTMRVFCHVIKEDAECRRDLKPLQTTVDNAIYSGSTITIPQENTITRAKRRWWLAYTLIRNPSLVQSRRLNPILEEVSLNDIESSVGNEDNTDKTGSLIFSCWKKCTCTIPPNISTNLMATLVLLMFALLYAGIPLLMEGL